MPKKTNENRPEETDDSGTTGDTGTGTTSPYLDYRCLLGLAYGHQQFGDVEIPNKEDFLDQARQARGEGHAQRPRRHPILKEKPYFQGMDKKVTSDAEASPDGLKNYPEYQYNYNLGKRMSNAPTLQR